MQSNTPSAFILSLTFHGLIIALLLLFTYVLKQQVKENPKIWELVAGEGDNYAATEAPAGGAEEVVKFNMPKVRTPVVRPKVEPVVKVIEPTPTPPKTVPKIVETKAPPKSKPVVVPPKTMSKVEFDKLHANQKNPTSVSAPKNIKVKSINVKGITNGSVKVSEGAGGKALSREEGKLLDAYIALLLQRLRAAHNKPTGLSDLLQASVQFNIGSNGVLTNVKIIQSSGSAAFDQSVLEAFAKVRSIGPTPDGKSDVWVVTFKMREDG
jgi:TonB family protein|uniref:TonB family protein n=1 Tax=Cephaloticoccus sp. TaxID=1985742 RepID=UPI00404A7E0D